MDPFIITVGLMFVVFCAFGLYVIHRSESTKH
jgi:hypothetical protein